MTETIIGSVKEAKFYYILCDEDIRQDFVKLIHCKPGLVGKIFTIKLLKHEEVFVLDLQNCCGQGYDDDSAVSGYVNSILALILRENIKAFYTHCVYHRLNLVTGTSCQILAVRNLLDIAKDITISSFLKFSPIQTEYLQNFI